MAIKKLITNTSSVSKFTIGANEGIFVFESNGNIHCLHLINPEDSELQKLNQFDNIKNLKYIGDENIYKKVFSKCTWQQATRTVFSNDPKQIIFHSQTGKIRFEKITNNKSPSIKNVLIVDDSKTIQKLLSKIIEKSPKLKLIGTANCPSEAKKIIETNQVDLITLDIHMPEMNGVEFLKSYLGAKNIPTVMISSVSISEGPLVMEALSSGAYTYIQKPSIEQLDQASSDIIEKLEELAKNGPRKKEFLSYKSNLKFDHFEGLIAIGSSTGGTQALQEIFTTLPDSIPPIVVVQHIPAVFSKALADRLNTLCTFTVKEAEDGEFLKKDTIYIAPGGKQMKLLKRGSEKRIAITDDPPVNRFQPSVDYLFNSISELEVKNLIGIILTGMGKDGAKGLLELKNSGAYTIAQDEESSIVFGMPKEAIAINAAIKVVSLQEMSANIVSEFNNFKKNKAA
ncbi:MAG: chemotaxis response regulator protein-glutamate methylesterase [Bacteriovoracaceae bacterium]